MDLLQKDPILNTPKHGGPSHAGPDFCCDSLWVWMTDSLEAIGTAPTEDPCSSQMVHEFKVLLAIPACSEGALGRTKDCQPVEDVCAIDPDTGCPQPDHKVGTNCGDGDQLVDGDRPTASQESAYIWRARSLMTQNLACAVTCCVAPRGMNEPCAQISCRGMTLTSVTQETEGGCAYLEFTLQARW